MNYLHGQVMKSEIGPKQTNKKSRFALLTVASRPASFDVASLARNKVLLFPFKLKVNIVTNGYDTIQRTQLVIHVYAKKLKFVCKDGRVLHFSHEPQELRDFILCQISQHQVSFILSYTHGRPVLKRELYLADQWNSSPC